MEQRPNSFTSARCASLLCMLLVLASGCSAGDGVAPGCIKRLNVHRIMPDVLPSSVLSQGSSGEGLGDLEKLHPDPERLREKFKIPAPPDYPHHSTYQFRFPLEAAHVEQVFGGLCDQIESALRRSCDSVRREDLHISCSFWTRDDELRGTLDVLPADVEAAQQVLIVVASEW